MQKIEYGMKINFSKTIVMKFSRTNDNQIMVKIDGQEIENINEFCYLNVRISYDGRDRKETKCRIDMVKKAFP